MIRFLLAVLLIATASSAEAGRRSDIIRDTCRADRSWVAYRNQFNAAVARRNAPALLRLVASDLTFNGQGSGGTGRAAFARQWGLARPATSPLWGRLAEMMSLGCGRDRQQPLHWVPSIFLDPDAPDDATYGPGAVVIAAGAALRARPTDSSRLVARLSWERILLPEHDDGRGDWVSATRDNDRQGYIRRSQVHSLTGPYALFQKRCGRWSLAYLGYRD
jgi:hypothetical protein